MDAYNILTEPWMPVIDRQGSEKLVGLRDYLINAHLYRKSAENKNLPILRRLQQRLAELFIADVLKNERIEDILDIGYFDPVLIDSYINDCEQKGISFDLFDQERPFLQTDRNTFRKIFLSGKGKESTSIAAINPRMCSGSNKVFFNPVTSKDYLNNTGAKDIRDSFYDDIYDSKYPCENANKVTFAEYVNLLLIAQCISGMGGSGYAAGLICAGNRPPILYQTDPQINESLFLSILMNTACDEFDDSEKDKPLWRWDSYENGSLFLKNEGISIPKKMGMFFPIQYIYPDIESIDWENKTISRIFKASMKVADKELFDKAREKWIVDTEPSVSIQERTRVSKDKDGNSNEVTIKSSTSFTESNRTWLDIRSYANISSGNAPESLSQSISADSPLREMIGRPIMTAYYLSMNQAKYLSQGSFNCYLPSCILNNKDKYKITERFIVNVEKISSCLNEGVNSIEKAFYAKNTGKSGKSGKISSIKRNTNNRLMRYCEGVFKKKFIPELALVDTDSKDYTAELSSLLEKYDSEVTKYSYKLLYQIPIPFGKSIEAEKQYAEIRKNWRRKK